MTGEPCHAPGRPSPSPPASHNAGSAPPAAALAARRHRGPAAPQASRPCTALRARHGLACLPWRTGQIRKTARSESNHAPLAPPWPDRCPRCVSRATGVWPRQAPPSGTGDTHQPRPAPYAPPFHPAPAQATQSGHRPRDKLAPRAPPRSPRALPRDTHQPSPPRQTGTARTPRLPARHGPRAGPGRHSPHRQKWSRGSPIPARFEGHAPPCSCIASLGAPRSQPPPSAGRRGLPPPVRSASHGPSGVKVTLRHAKARLAPQFGRDPGAGCWGSCIASLGAVPFSAPTQGMAPGHLCWLGGADRRRLSPEASPRTSRTSA